MLLYAWSVLPFVLAVCYWSNLNAAIPFHTHPYAIQKVGTTENKDVTEYHRPRRHANTETTPSNENNSSRMAGDDMDSVDNRNLFFKNLLKVNFNVNNNWNKNIHKPITRPSKKATKTRTTKKSRKPARATAKPHEPPPSIPAVIPHPSSITESTTKLITKPIMGEPANCTTPRKENDRYSSSFLGNATNESISVDKEFKVAGEAGAKKKSSVHIGEDITLCWIETTTIKEDTEFQPPKRLVIREFTISFENSATIPERYLECVKLEGEVTPGSDIGKTALFEVIDENTRVSRVVNFTTVSHVDNLVIRQHKRVRCGVGPVVSKNVIEWTNDLENPKKRVEIKVSPKMHRLVAQPTGEETNCSTDIVPKPSNDTTLLLEKEGLEFCKNGTCYETIVTEITESTTLKVPLESKRTELLTTDVTNKVPSTEMMTGKVTTTEDTTTITEVPNTTTEIEDVTEVTTWVPLEEETTLVYSTKKTFNSDDSCQDKVCDTSKTTKVTGISTTSLETTVLPTTKKLESSTGTTCLGDDCRVTDESINDATTEDYGGRSSCSDDDESCTPCSDENCLITTERIKLSSEEEGNKMKEPCDSTENCLESCRNNNCDQPQEETTTDSDSTISVSPTEPEDIVLVVTDPTPSIPELDNQYKEVSNKTVHVITTEGATTTKTTLVSVSDVITVAPCNASSKDCSETSVCDPNSREDCLTSLTTPTVPEATKIVNSSCSGEDCETSTESIWIDIPHIWNVPPEKVDNEREEDDNVEREDNGDYETEEEKVVDETKEKDGEWTTIEPATSGTNVVVDTTVISSTEVETTEPSTTKSPIFTTESRSEPSLKSCGSSTENCTSDTINSQEVTSTEDFVTTVRTTRKNTSSIEIERSVESCDEDPNGNCITEIVPMTTWDMETEGESSSTTKIPTTFCSDDPGKNCFSTIQETSEIYDLPSTTSSSTECGSGSSDDCLAASSKIFVPGTSEEPDSSTEETIAKSTYPSTIIKEGTTEEDSITKVTDISTATESSTTTTRLDEPMTIVPKIVSCDNSLEDCTIIATVTEETDPPTTPTTPKASSSTTKKTQTTMQRVVDMEDVSSCESDGSCESVENSVSCEDLSSDCDSFVTSSDCDEDSTDCSSEMFKRMITPSTLREVENSSTSVDDVATTVETRRTTVTSLSKHKLALKIKVLLQHIDENENKQDLIKVEKHFLFNENPNEHGNHSLIQQIKSLNDSVNMETVQTLFNCSSLEKLASDVNKMTTDIVNKKGIDSLVWNNVAEKVVKGHHVRAVTKKSANDVSANIQQSLPDVHDDIHLGLDHVISQFSDGKPIVDEVGADSDTPRLQLLKIISDPTDSRIYRRRKRDTVDTLTIDPTELPDDVKEVDHWSNERVKRALNGGHVKSLTEFTIYRGL